MEKKMKTLEEKIGYHFKDKELLKLALTHSSKKGIRVNNERLEFLGDAVLELVISEYLFANKKLSEGKMTKLRASIVCAESLSKAAQRLHLGSYLILGKGEAVTGGRDRRSNLANAFEAVLGAIFKDSNFEVVRTIILNLLEENIKNALEGKLFKDYKTTLQEQIQKHGENVIEYVLIDAIGPEHDKVFQVELQINHISQYSGKGKSKKEAEQNAAKAYLIHAAKGN